MATSKGSDSTHPRQSGAVHHVFAGSAYRVHHFAKILKDCASAKAEGVWHYQHVVVVVQMQQPAMHYQHGAQRSPACAGLLVRGSKKPQGAEAPHGLGDLGLETPREHSFQKTRAPCWRATRQKIEEAPLARTPDPTNRRGLVLDECGEREVEWALAAPFHPHGASADGLVGWVNGAFVVPHCFCSCTKVSAIRCGHSAPIRSTSHESGDGFGNPARLCKCNYYCTINMW